MTPNTPTARGSACTALVHVPRRRRSGPRIVEVATEGLLELLCGRWAWDLALELAFIDLDRELARRSMT